MSDTSRRPAARRPSPLSPMAWAMRPLLRAMDHLRSYRRVAVLTTYLVVFVAAYVLAYLLRFDFVIPAAQRRILVLSLPLLVTIRLAGFYLFGLHRGLWRYASIGDLVTIVKASTVTSVVFTATAAMLFPKNFPRTVYLLDWLMCMGMVAGLRAMAIIVRERSLRHLLQSRTRAVIVGAGDAADMLLRELDLNPFAPYEAVALVDDDRGKLRSRIRGVEVQGTVNDLPFVVTNTGAEEVIIAIPSASKPQLRRIVSICQDTRVRFRRMPAVAQMIEGVLKVAQLQDIRPEDLLDREVIHVDPAPIWAQLSGGRVLITGAAGSIGAELARQVAEMAPGHLVLVDRAESNLYFVSLELRNRTPDLAFTPVVGDVTNLARMREVLADYRPHVIYHAAAYKHVPLMEDNPLEAIENNVLGTEVLAREAARAGVGKFILISTDKAVEPVSVMGMTKRAAELVALSSVSEAMACVVVRFGNVLGSDGSVLPLFKWQVSTQGQLAVTDPKASRYFMLPSEAVQLVLEAGRMGEHGDIFFLHMGEPVRIMELASRLLTRAGLEPDLDVPITISGLRPGERLNERLVAAREELQPTEHERIFRIRTDGFDRTQLLRDLEALRELVARRDRPGAVDLLRRIARVY